MSCKSLQLEGTFMHRDVIPKACIC